MVEQNLRKLVSYDECGIQLTVYEKQILFQQTQAVLKQNEELALLFDEMMKTDVFMEQMFEPLQLFLDEPDVIRVYQAYIDASSERERILEEKNIKTWGNLTIEPFQVGPSTLNQHSHDNSFPETANHSISSIVGEYYQELSNFNRWKTGRERKT